MHNFISIILTIFIFHPFLGHASNLIFGYGVLINTELREQSLSEKSVAIPARLSSEFGYIRTWNFKGPSYSALGIEKRQKGAPINGIVYSVNVDDMTLWDQFEKGYDRIQVPREVIEYTSWLQPKEDAKIWIYVPKPDFQALPDEYSPLMQSYLDTVLAGCLEHGEAFAREFLETTTGWPKWWLNDRVVTKNAWSSRREQKYIDQLLEDHPSSSAENMFLERKDFGNYQNSIQKNIFSNS